MKRKFKQFHQYQLSEQYLNKNETTTYVVDNPGPGQAQQCGGVQIYLIIH